MRVSSIRATVEERSHGCRAPRANGAVQGCHAAVVRGVGISTSCDEADHGLGLPGGIPRMRARYPISCIVKRPCASSILLVDTCTMFNEQGDDLRLVGRCRNVKRRIASTSSGHR
jgi:hypothetical protein